MSVLSLYTPLITSLLFSLLIVFLLYALTAAGFWLIFGKAGQPVWIALVPFYNIYIQYKISWDVTWFWIYIGGLTAYMLLHGHNWFFNGISCLALLISFGISLMAAFQLAKSFGKDNTFAIGLFFLGPVFLLILGLDQSQYLGIRN